MVHQKSFGYHFLSLLAAFNITTWILNILFFLHDDGGDFNINILWLTLLSIPTQALLFLISLFLVPFICRSIKHKQSAYLISFFVFYLNSAIFWLKKDFLSGYMIAVSLPAVICLFLYHQFLIHEQWKKLKLVAAIMPLAVIILMSIFSPMAGGLLFLFSYMTFAMFLEGLY